MNLVKSFTNVDNDRFPKGCIIVYEHENNQCYREVEKDNTWYWHKGVSFQQPEEATEAWALELIEHPMEPPHTVDYFRSEKAAKFRGSELFPSELYGAPIVWRVIKLF